MEATQAHSAGQRRAWCHPQLCGFCVFLHHILLRILQLEWLTEVPWSQSTSSTSIEKLKDRAFLRNARAQLDSDHFGLEKVKRRLIEYLAVVR